MFCSVKVSMMMFSISEEGSKYREGALGSDSTF